MTHIVSIFHVSVDLVIDVCILMIISNVCWRFHYGAGVVMVIMLVAAQCFCKIKCKEVCAHAVTLRDTGICFESITLFFSAPDFELSDG